MNPVEPRLLIAAVLLLLAIVASKASSRLGIPGLLLFLGIGMLAGSDGLGGIYFDDAFLAQAVGVVALAFILFSGGLGTDRSSTSVVFWKGLSLSTIGVVVTALVVGVVARHLVAIPWLEAFLLGAIVSSTDAAAVFSVLRAQKMKLKGHIQPLLEFESGSNDPMAVFVTVGLIRLITTPGDSVLDLVPMFALQMALGAGAGILIGKATVFLLNRLKLESEGLYPVLTVAVVLLTYGGVSLIKGNGFLAVYLAGIYIGNEDFIHKRSLVRFHDGVAWLMQITMFLVLGLLVFPSRLWPVAGVGLLLALTLMFAARPASVFLSLLLSREPKREKVLVSWVGLRGAVPIILATFPMLARLPNAELYFNIVFFIVLTSVLLQGTTIGLVARKLNLQAPESLRRQYPLELVPGSKLKSDMLEIEVPPDSPAAGKQIVELKLPDSALIVLIGRGDEFIAPRGSTVLEPGDTLLVLSEKDDQTALERSLCCPGGSLRKAPWGPSA